MKERLTGAVILVALIVLLVPELLTGPIRSAPRASAAATAGGDEPPVRTYTIDLADDAHAHARAAVTELPAPAPAAAPPAAPAAPPATAPSAAAGSAAVDGSGTAASDRRKSTVAQAPAAPGVAGTSGAWMVQLGSFASRDNAERLAKQLRAGGFQVSVSQGSTGRRLYRVRAGPAHDRAAAEQLAGKLRAAGQKGEIVPK